MKTIDLFDTIEDQSVRLQPHGVVNMKRIEELTMQKVDAHKTEQNKRRRSLGVYLLAAALITMLIATSVVAYIGFTQYNSPEEMMHIFFGDEALPSLESEEVFYPYPEGGGYTVLHPAAQRVPLDEELVQKAPPIAMVNQSAVADGNTVTVIAHQHDSALGSGTIYYTVENPAGVTGYETQANGVVFWPKGELVILHGCVSKQYIIPDQTTENKLAVACYYVGAKWEDDWQEKQCLEMHFKKTGFGKSPDPVMLPLDIFETVNSLTSKNGEIIVTSIGMELHLENMKFLWMSVENGTVQLPPDTFNIKYLAVQFNDGTEYVIKNDRNNEYVANDAYTCTYSNQEEGFTIGAYLFNRIIDLDKAKSVIINDEEFKLS